jgi:hypothetical protein
LNAAGEVDLLSLAIRKVGCAERRRDGLCLRHGSFSLAS